MACSLRITACERSPASPWGRTDEVKFIEHLDRSLQVCPARWPVKVARRSLE